MIKNAVLVSFFALLGLFALAGCNTTISGQEDVAEYNADPLSVPIAPDVSSDVLEKAMNTTFTERGWTVVSSSPTEVVGRLNHRGFDAEATMKREGNEIKIYSDTTKLEGFKSGQPEPAVPLGWLENLQKDLPRYISSMQ